MSLTREQELATKRELREAMDLVGMDLKAVADALSVSPELVEQALDLRGSVIENPWVLKEYLADQARAKGLVPVSFTALRGNYHDYWFLDAARIDARVMR